MAATVGINRWTGTTGAPTKTAVTGGTSVINAVDDPNPGVSNPIKRPTSGINYSFWACFRLAATTTPAGLIQNIRWYSDGANNFATGISMVGQTSPTYRQATGTVNETGTALNTTNYPELTAPPVNVFTFTSGSPKLLNGTLTNPNTGDFGDFFVQQFQVADTAGPGDSGQESFTFTYDET